MTTKRKGQRFWTIRMNPNDATHIVVAVTFQQRDPSFKGGSDFYKVPFEYESKREFTVVDIEDKNIFRTEKEALVECIKRCHAVADKCNRRAHDLAVRLSKI